MTTTNTYTKTDWKNNRLGGLWKNKSKKGDSYFKGAIRFQTDIKAGQQIEILLFDNKEKKTDNQPDVNVYIAEPRESNGQNPQPKTSQPVQNKVAATTPEDEVGVF